MKEIPIGLTSQAEIIPEKRHSADSAGNAGVHVVSTPALIGFFEQTSHRALGPYCDPGEASVGTRIEVDHLAAATLDRPIAVTARVAAVERRRVTFEVELKQGHRIIMKGRHGRAIVVLDRLLGQPRPQ